MNNTVDESIERLIGFGIGAAAAQEIIRQMTLCSPYRTSQYAYNTNQNATVAFVNNKKEEVSVYFIIIDDKQAGPYSETELSSLIANAKISKDTLVWKPGMTEWKRAEDIPSVLKYFVLNSTKTESSN